MAASGSSSSSVPSLPPPRPKSPPEYPDLYGKRRELAKVQMLEREISYLEGELKFVGNLQPATRCCKEVADFVVATSDPFLPTNQKVHKSCRFWKWLCGAPCFNLSWICCFGCTPCLDIPCCCHCNLCTCHCNLCTCHSCAGCSLPKCRCCSWPRWRCFHKISCSSKCCFPRCPNISCPDCSCRWRCSYPECPKCPKVNLCCCCTKNCCYPCCLC